jgi:protein-S-isoprenylcysteine O-methyltransferase Ste14
MATRITRQAGPPRPRLRRRAEHGTVRDQLRSVVERGTIDQVTRQAWEGLAQLLLALLLFLFLPAGSLGYWQGWLYIALFGVSVSAITWWLQRNDPELLRRRLVAGPSAEKDPRQKLIQAIASVAFIGIFIVAGLDHRFRWSTVPTGLVLLGDFLVVLGLWLVFLTFRENSFTSAAIEISAGQAVVSTGPYAVVRHPMYAGALVMLLGTPLALGSWWALGPFLILLLTIIWRLLDEEQFLARDLPGYDAYRAKVRHRLLPYTW